MAEAIDSLFVKLGLQTDKEQFAEADSQFKSLKTTALQLGGAFATVGAAGFGLVSKFAGRTDEIGQFADRMDTSAGFVNALGFALEKVGGSADDAFSSIENMRSLLQDADWGRIGDNLEGLSAGLDFEAIRNAETLRDAYLEIAQQIQGLDTEQQRRVLDELGFGGEQMNLFMSGPDAISESLGRGEQLAPVTDEMTEAAREFNEALTELTTNARGISDVIALRLAPAISMVMSRIVGEEGGREGFEARYEDLIAGTVREFEGLRVFAEAVGRGDTVRVLQELVRGVSYLATGEAPELTGPDADPTSYLFPEAGGGEAVAGGSTQTNYVTVDARGSTNPQETADRVTRGVIKTLEELTGRARDDFVEQRQ